MNLKTVNILAPVKVRNCHLRFPGEAGADQYRRRQHLLERVSKEKEHTPKSVYRLESETTFKAGEVVETDFVFPKAMRDKARYADDVDDPEAEASDTPAAGEEADAEPDPEAEAATPAGGRKGRRGAAAKR